MMKVNKLILTSLISLLTISGCGVKDSSSSMSSSSKTDSTSSVFKGYVDLSEAYSNTTQYALKVTGSESKDYVEIYLDDMFYFDMNKIGFVELEEDEGFLHSFTTINTSNEIISREMVVYGRTSGLEYLDELKEKTLMYLIAQNFKFFEKENENTYSCDTHDFIYNVAEHFQTKMYKYATKIELTVGKDNQLEHFRIYEETAKLLELEFNVLDYKDLEMYKKWVNSGSVIDERIYDYKTIYEDDGDVISIYEGTEVEFEATVIAKDAYGNIYVANRNDEVGHIGIKIVTNDDVSKINKKDIVKVKGIIRTKNLNTYLNNAEIEDTGKDAKYAPIFDEDVLVDSMGGGAYAANLFVAYPQFGDSLYSTYAYVNNMTNDLEKDIKVDVMCPTQAVEDVCYHMEITIPKELPLEKRQELYNELQNAGKYGEENAYELSLQKFLIKYDSTYAYRIKLEATEDTEIIRRPSLNEKIESSFGLSDFPIPEGIASSSYYFGGFTNRFLETEYALEGETEGLFISFSSMSQEQIDTYFATLEANDLEKYDEVKDRSDQRHILYQKNNVNFDMLITPDTYEENKFTLYMWMYSGELIVPSSTEERLQEEIGDWFNVENFLKFSGTYDADYTIYKLREYAGEFYSEENPLYCITIDTNEDIFDGYNLALTKEMGYKSYRVNNFPYTYMTRGQLHYVYEKDGVYCDVAMYPTSDYTYTGHKEFEYRLEILLYTDEPMSVKTYDDLSVLSNLYNEIDPSLAYYPELPEDAVVEIWRDLGDFNLAPVTYGYGYRNEAFVYTEHVDDAYEAVKDAALDAGYELSIEKTRSALFSKTIDGTLYNIFILKEPEKGYLRVMNDIGGVDFMI